MVDTHFNVMGLIINDAATGNVTTKEVDGETKVDFDAYRQRYIEAMKAAQEQAKAEKEAAATDETVVDEVSYFGGDNAEST